MPATRPPHSQCATIASLVITSSGFCASPELFCAMRFASKAMPGPKAPRPTMAEIALTAAATSMSKAASVVIANANLVKQVVFPLEVLPIKGILASGITQLIATVLLVIYTLVTTGSLPWTYVLLPVLWGLQFLAVGGVCYLLASLSVYFRDVKDVLQLFCTAGVYFMPVFYLPAWVPEPIRPVLYVNPFSYLAW